MKHRITATGRGAATATTQRATPLLPAWLANANWPLIALIVVGVALRLWLISVNRLDPRFSDADDGDYYRRALRFAVTGQYVDDAWLIRPPMHVFFYALWLRVALLLNHPEWGVRLIQLAQTVLAGLTIPLCYGIARRTFRSERAGLLFALFFALWFSFVEQPTVLFSELIYLFFWLLHVWLLLRFDGNNRLRDLALSGLALGVAALTRSPALYSLAFVALWLVGRAWRGTGIRGRGSGISDQEAENREPKTGQSVITQVVVQGAVVVLCCLAVVLPWTARNYAVYGQLIPVDTLGQINLWLDLDPVSERTAHIEELRRLPQAERQAYASARAREILAADPLRPFRNMWPTFRHIWKAQFVEDFVVKQSFFGRPLGPAAPLGFFGDVVWLVFTVAGLIGLAGPVREGWHNRVFWLAWLGYSLVTVLVFHVEPRYLLPIWTLIALYGAGTLGTLWGQQRQVGSGRWRLLFLLLQMLVVLAFAALFVSYRNYPALLAQGWARSQAMGAAQTAYTRGDYAGAEANYRAALAAQPGNIDGEVGLALALTAQGRRDQALAALGDGGSRQAQALAGMLARDTGQTDSALAQLGKIEPIASENIQRWAITWVRSPATTGVAIGNGLDLGYVAGFSPAEQSAAGSYRWLEGDGTILLPLPQPASADQQVVLRLTSGRDQPAPLTVRINGGAAQQIDVQPGQWRVYHLALPPEAIGAQQIRLDLHAPVFVPARTTPGSNDARALSLMASAAGVQ